MPVDAFNVALENMEDIIIFNFEFLQVTFSSTVIVDTYFVATIECLRHAKKLLPASVAKGLISTFLTVEKEEKTAKNSITFVEKSNSTFKLIANWNSSKTVARAIKKITEVNDNNQLQLKSEELVDSTFKVIKHPELITVQVENVGAEQIEEIRLEDIEICVQEEKIEEVLFKQLISLNYSCNMEHVFINEPLNNFT